jgi:hypothetical protein
MSLTPKKCGISSIEANKKSNKTKCVNDHIVGVTSCSEYIINDIFLCGKDSKEFEWIDKKNIYVIIG